LTLLGASSSSTVNLAVGSDTTSISTAINQFVTDYNTALKLVNAQFTVTSSTDSTTDTTTASEGVLATDPTLVSLQSTLEQALNYGYAPTTGTITISSLYDLGITADKDTGLLSVDSTTLDNALTNNPTDVQNFFEGTALDGFANSLSNSLNTYTDSADGAFTVDLSSISTQNSDLTTEINDFETNYIAPQETLLTADFSEAEVALQEMPQKMAELNSELGFTNNSSSSS
jgi:flagellar hook-associated protein 2